MLLENVCCLLYAVTVYLQEEERRKKQDMEMGGWTGTATESRDAVQSPPIQQIDTTYPPAQGDAGMAVNKF